MVLPLIIAGAEALAAGAAAAAPAVAAATAEAAPALLARGAAAAGARGMPMAANVLGKAAVNPAAAELAGQVAGRATIATGNAAAQRVVQRSSERRQPRP